MKQIIYILLGWILLINLSCQPSYVDPTGTYELESKTEIIGDDTYGYFGNIQVEKINKDKIVMAFMICKGAPSYNSGSFVDTLKYYRNSAIYTIPEIDPSCQIKFDFSKNGVVVKEKADNFNCGCGFGHAVIADGFFKKVSSSQPILENSK